MLLVIRLTWSEIDLKQEITELKDGRSKTGKSQVMSQRRRSLPS
jgi:hypothetical protein